MSTSFTRRPQALHQTQPDAVEKTRHQPVGPLQLREQRPHLAVSQYHRQLHRPLRAHQIIEPAKLLSQNLPVEEEQRRERLILRRGGNIAIGGQMTEKRRHLALAERRGMTLARPKDEAPDPVHVSLLRAAAVVQAPNRLVHPIKQPGLTPVRGFTPREIRHLTPRAQPITICVYIQYTLQPGFCKRNLDSADLPTRLVRFSEYDFTLDCSNHEQR